MQKKMYSILDRTVNTFFNPIHFVDDADAIRWFTTAVNNKNKQQASNIELYPEQFQLWSVGEFNDSSGQFTGTQKQLIDGLSVKDTEKVYTIKDLIEEIRRIENEK